MICGSASRVLALVVAASAVVVCRAGSTQAPASATFAAQIAALSEPEGYFDTDNLISNESSYLGVLPDIARANLRGGAYVGVGPDQNFSYIAAARPDVAFIIDVRRDNLLLHLLFKGLFALARTRMDYLALLSGRAPPADVAAWSGKSIAALVEYIDAAAAPVARDTSALRARVTSAIQSFGVALSAADLATLDRFHRRFIEAGLSLRFESLGRSPQPYYPTLGQLLLATDSAGRHGNYLAAEESFQFIKRLQERDRIIPVVGNLAGTSAMAAIGKWLREHDQRVSVIYASNVEFYLFREGRYPMFMTALSRMPIAPNALVIRSVFGGGGASYSLTQSAPELVEGFAKGRYRSYFELAR